MTTPRKKIAKSRLEALAPERAPEPLGPAATDDLQGDPGDTRSRILQAAVKEFASEGYGGARVERICATARSNPRMLYHYFGDKAALYVAVLEHVLQMLRAEEVKLGVDDMEPLAGIMKLFEFVNGHFGSHPELHQLLSGENLLRAAFLRGSRRVRVESSPLIEILARLLRRGERGGAFRRGIDPLHLYVLIVSLCYYHRSNAYTLSVLFETDLTARSWQDEHEDYARQMLRSFLIRR
jgi:AcrR family transcriptional regulator